MMSRHALSVIEGLTHASSVIPVLRSKDWASGIVTRAELPSNDRALPNFPAAAHVALAIVPTFPLPDASPADAPAPSLNAYAATSEEVIERVVALAVPEYPLRLPA